MGLAFDTISSTQSTPFWQTLSQSGQLANQEMGFWLTRAGKSQGQNNVVPGGVFTLGGVNSTFINGDIDFVDMPAGTQPSFWLLSMSGTYLKQIFLCSCFLSCHRCYYSRSIHPNFLWAFCYRYWYDFDWWPNRRGGQGLECRTECPGNRIPNARFLGVS
jgi:hypothetical protein